MDDELQHGDEGIPEKKENPNADQSNPKKKASDTPVSVVPAKSNLTPPKGHDSCKKYKWIKEEIKYWFEIFGIIAGVAVLIVLIGQLREMVRTTNVAVGQLKAMQGQLDTMRLDERAWVAVRQGNIRGTVFPDITFEVTFRNTGKTPAINVSAFMDQAITTNSIIYPDESAFFDTSKFSGLLAPDAEGNIKISGYSFREGISVQQAISNGSIPYYVYGSIWYDDIFGKHHWSQFCYEIRLTPDASAVAQWLPINIHNSCDDAQTNQTN